MSWRIIGIIGLLVLSLATAAFGHEVRPAYLELREERPNQFAVLWKTPMRGAMRLALAPVISGATETLTPIVTRQTDAGAAVQTWTLRTATPLRGLSIRIEGLDSTMTDALVRIQFLDGTTWVQRFTPQSQSIVVPERQSPLNVAGTYMTLGVEHILLGIDHLLFVLALLIIIYGRSAPASDATAGQPVPNRLRRLVATVTAFTIAHSITLALATLGVVNMPGAPVEAIIALSIVFVAAEILHQRNGRAGVAGRAPWIVAFGFGLLHGFGFAGALTEIGLPEGHIPLALLFFNLGVEAGQLLFVAVALAVAALVKRSAIPLPRWCLETVPPYAIGSIAMFWAFQRIAGF